MRKNDRVTNASKESTPQLNMAQHQKLRKQVATSSRLSQLKTILLIRLMRGGEPNFALTTKSVNEEDMFHHDPKRRFRHDVELVKKLTRTRLHKRRDINQLAKLLTIERMDRVINSAATT